MPGFGTAILTDDVLANLMPTLTSTTIVALRPRDVRRGGTPPPIPEGDDLFDRHVLAASDDVSTERFGVTTGPNIVEKRRKPTDSFTLNPEMVRRVFESTAIEVIDPISGDHLAFVRGLIFRDTLDRVAKVQCFLAKGHYLSPDGGKIAFRVSGETYRIRDGFYVTPRGAHSGEWCYLGYIR